MMFTNNTRPLLLFALAGLFAAATVLGQTRLTIAIECGAQGQVDDPHKLTVTVIKCDREGKPTEDTTTVTIPVQAQTDSSAIADTTARVLAKKGVKGTTSGETTNPRYGEGSKHKAEDIIIPKGYKVGSVKVEKKKGNGYECDDGHLQAYIGKKQVSNQDNGRVVFHDRRTVKPAFVEPTAQLPIPYTWLDVTIPSGSWTAPTLVLDLYEPDADGNPVWAHSFEQTFPAGTTTSEALKALGAYLEGLGMVVLYPDLTSLSADIAASGLPIVGGAFSAQVSEQTTPDDWVDVEFTFDLQ